MTAIETKPQTEQAAENEDIQQLSGHTIMMIHFSSNEETRTWMDCASPYDAMETFMRIYDSFIINKQGLEGGDEQMEDGEKKGTITYKLEDILKFIDQLYDLSVMVYNDKAHGFTAHGKAWVKGKIHAYLRRIAE